MLHGLNVFVRTVLIAAGVGLAGWWTFFLNGRINEHERELAARDAKISELELAVADRDREIQRLETSLRLLKVDHRIARLEVLAQRPSAEDPDQIETVLRFSEIGPDGAPLASGREIVVQGTRAYVEALVIKFNDDYVEQGEVLRGTSICLFDKIFGEDDLPSEGQRLDATGTRPWAYSAEEPDGALHSELWEHFWEIANDPDAARERGVRAIHGEAPFMELRPNRSYRLELRASGGLSIVPER